MFNVFLKLSLCLILSSTCHDKIKWIVRENVSELSSWGTSPLYYRPLNIPLVLSQQEIDQLYRSKKKTKHNFKYAIGAMGAMDQPTYLEIFRAKILEFHDLEGESTDWVDSDEEVLALDHNFDYPIVWISREEKIWLRAHWHKALIIKLLGHRTGQPLLIRLLMVLWKSRGDMSIIDAGNGFFVAKFNLAEDPESHWVMGLEWFFITTWRFNLGFLFLTIIQIRLLWTKWLPRLAFFVYRWSILMRTF